MKKTLAKVHEAMRADPARKARNMERTLRTDFPKAQCYYSLRFYRAERQQTC